MRFKNYTTMADEQLREIVRFCRPSGVSGFDIAFKNSYCFHGRCYPAGTSYHDRSVNQGRLRGTFRSGPLRYNTPYVVIDWTRLAFAFIVNGKVRMRRQYQFTSQGAYLGVIVYSTEEAIVSLVAHELRHLWQRRVKTGHRVWGARGQYSERDADAYAIQMVRQWRRR